MTEKTKKLSSYCKHYNTQYNTMNSWLTVIFVVVRLIYSFNSTQIHKGLKAGMPAKATDEN